MSEILITNNPAAASSYAGRLETIYLEDAAYLTVLYQTRDKIHEGHRLVTHPLSGSIKPGQTPYKSILITKAKGDLDVDSLKIIEDSIVTARKLTEGKKEPVWPEKTLEDFQLIDLDLITRR